MALIIISFQFLFNQPIFQYFDTVGWATGRTLSICKKSRTSDLQKFFFGIL